jgi:hypothetical protein
MMMYPRDDERKIRVQRMIGDWAESGLVHDDQRMRMLADVQVDYRRTNPFLRITLFLFGLVIVVALLALMASVLDIRNDGIAALAAIAAAASFFAAQAAIERYRLYRFGIEEALAVAAVMFFALACSMFMTSRFSSFQMFLGAAGAAVIVFRRFAFLYAGIAAVLLTAVIPLNVPVYQGDTTRRLFSIVLLTVIFGIARERRNDHDGEFPGDRYGVLETTAWVAIYVLTNFEISQWLSLEDGYQFVRRATYAGIWILPAVGLWLAIRDRHRWMLDANIVMAIVTLMTNKAYLGAERKPWDPILFGVMLIVIALGLKRWLSAGKDGSRAGFIPDRLLASERDRLNMAGGVTALAPGAPAPHTHASGPDIGGGGRSGGAGASGKF